MPSGIIAAAIVGSAVMGTVVEASGRSYLRKPDGKPNEQALTIGKTLQVASIGFWLPMTSRALAFIPALVPLARRIIEQKAPHSCPAQCMQNGARGLDGLVKAANVLVLAFFAFVYGGLLVGGLNALVACGTLGYANYRLWNAECAQNITSTN